LALSVFTKESVLKILRVNHLGLAPKNPEACLQFLTKGLGLPSQGSEKVSEQKVEVEFFAIDDTRLELLRATETDSPVAKFIETKGGGIQHLALEVDDVIAWIEHLKTQGYKMIDDVPRIGAHNTSIAFVHPASTGGLLIELVQEGKKHP
jgi:methylmalonyl-CoA/ethylmalonyl-CoA epimerase